MYNWSVNTTRFKKNSAEYIKWKLEQTINYGLNNNKLHEEELRKYLPKLTIDPHKRRYLEFLVYGKNPFNS